MIPNSFRSGWTNGIPSKPKTIAVAPADAVAACVPVSKLSPVTSALLISSGFDLTVC